VDSGFDENETEFGVLVLSVAFKMLADGDSLGRDRHVRRRMFREPINSKSWWMTPSSYAQYLLGK
jgi:hypothetical protein